MEPAASIIKLCGGHAIVAAICGIDITRVYRWTYPRERGGTGGIVPDGKQQLLLSGARGRGVDLRPEHFFATVPPVESSAGETSTKLAESASHVSEAAE